MKQDNIILDKSFAFAIRVVKLYKYLCDELKTLRRKFSTAKFEFNLGFAKVSKSIKKIKK